MQFLYKFNVPTKHVQKFENVSAFLNLIRKKIQSKMVCGCIENNLNALFLGKKKKKNPMAYKKNHKVKNKIRLNFFFRNTSKDIRLNPEIKPKTIEKAAGPAQYKTNKTTKIPF